MSFSRRCSKLSIALIAIFILLLGVFFLSGVTASAEEARTLDFSLQTVSTASEVSPATFRYISAGDTFTLTYALEANGGLDVAYIFPLYDESAFKLTSVTIGDAWHIAEDYYVYYDETTGEEETLTLAEHLLRFDEEYLASLEDDDVIRTYDRMSFELYPSAFGVYPTAESFLVLEFTARADVLDAADFVFGFDFAPIMQSGLPIATTNAARYSHYSPVDGGSVELLLFRMRVGEEYLPMAANALETSYVATVVPTIAAEIPAGQTISFEDNLFPVDEVLSSVTYPATPNEGENPYLAEGGVRTLRFYLPDPEDPTAVGELLEGVPQTAGEYFVQAIYSDTTHYQGIATEIVPITVLKEVITPELEGFLASAPETAIPEAEKLLDITFTYGDAATVKDGGAAFDASKYVTTYYVSEDGETWTSVSSDPILSNVHPHAGFYKVTLAPLYPETQTFGFDAELYTILIEVEKAALTARAASYEITYGDALPTYAYALEGKDAADDESAIRLLLQATLALSPAYDGAGVYAIDLDGEAALADYVVTYVDGVLTVNAKPLTLVASYDGGAVTFSLQDGNGVAVAVPATYKIGETAATAVALDSNVYSAEAAYALAASVRKAWADAGKNYTVSSLALAAPCRVSYSATVAGATGLPAEPIYLFAGQLVPVPATTPTAEHHEFLYWAAPSAAYDFASPITGDLELVAVFDKTEYAYAFRAAIFTDGETPTPAGEMRVLTWSEGEGAFLLSDTAETFIFLKGAAIPVLSDVKYFKVSKWYKAVPDGAGYLYSEISSFTPDATAEGESGVLLVACMVFDVAEGDLNGDRVVNVEDVIRLRKYIAHYNLADITISTVDAAWAAVTAETPVGGYFFPSAVDVDHDGVDGLADAIYVTQALVSGYEYVKVTDSTVNGVYVAGERVIAREGNLVDVSDGETLEKYAYLGLSLRLTEDLLVGYVDESGETPETVTFDFLYDGDTFLLDLGGKTVTMDTLVLKAKGAIEIKNGSVICEGYDIEAAGGVTITDVAGLPAADGSATAVTQD